MDYFLLLAWIARPTFKSRFRGFSVVVSADESGVVLGTAIPRNRGLSVHLNLRLKTTVLIGLCSLMIVSANINASFSFDIDGDGNKDALTDGQVVASSNLAVPTNQLVATACV